jgi:leucyl aminopeptidase
MYAVGKGSVHKPAAINLTYRGDKENPTKMFALVGKGVTFDSGGYNIKTGDFTNMYADKGGACA